MSEEVKSENKSHMSAQELIEEIDLDGNIIGVHPKDKLKQEMFMHKVSVIIPKGNENKVVLCRRAKDKYPFPNTWCCAVGGKVAAGESYEQAAIREMIEEIGMELEIEHVVDVIYNEEDERARFGVFTTKSSVSHEEFVLDPREIQFTKEFTIEEIQQMIDRQPEEFAPTFRKILKEFAEK